MQKIDYGPMDETLVAFIMPNVLPGKGRDSLRAKFFDNLSRLGIKALDARHFDLENDFNKFAFKLGKTGISLTNLELSKLKSDLMGKRLFIMVFKGHQASAKFRKVAYNLEINFSNFNTDLFKSKLENSSLLNLLLVSENDSQAIQQMEIWFNEVPGKKIVSGLSLIHVNKKFSDNTELLNEFRKPAILATA